jgi:hypothetical protein
MRITARQLRQVIREELHRGMREGDETELPATSPSRKSGSKVKAGPDNEVGVDVVISPTSYVGNSQIGFPDQDTTSIQGESNIINSYVVGNSTVSNSDVNSSKISDASKIESNSKLQSVDVVKCNIWDSTLTVSAPVVGRVRKVTYLYEVYDTTVKDSFVKDSKTWSSKITGYSHVVNSVVNSSELLSSDVTGCKLSKVKLTGATITFTEAYDGIATVSDAIIEHVDITDSRIGGKASIKCSRGSESFIKLASIYGPVKISGSVKIAGLVSEKDGHKQEASVTDNAQVSGNAQISGRVSGNAQVSGYAEVHGLAHVTGDCKVSGTAKMISGTFTTGEYTSGEHEGGDGLVDRVMKAFDF